MWHSTFQHFVSGFIYHTPQQIYNSVFQWIFACQLSFLQHDTHTRGCQTLVSPWFTPTDLRLRHILHSPHYDRHNWLNNQREISWNNWRKDKALLKILLFPDTPILEGTLIKKRLYKNLMRKLSNFS